MTREEQKEYGKKWYQAHREEVLAKKKAQRENASSEEIEAQREYRRKYYRANKEKFTNQTEEQRQAKREYSKKYRETHKEQIKAWREANKERLSECKHRYNMEHRGEMAVYMRSYREARKGTEYDCYPQRQSLYCPIERADKGKIRALLKARWTVSDIASDMDLNEDELKAYLEENNG